MGNMNDQSLINELVKFVYENNISWVDACAEMDVVYNSVMHIRKRGAMSQRNRWKIEKYLKNKKAI